MLKNDPLKSKRIFVGFNSAGAIDICNYTRVLRRRGYKIDFYSIKKSWFGMPTDKLIVFSENKIISFFQRLICFFKLLSSYDIWHFNYMEAFFFYPLNLLILKLLGKKIVCTLRGSEARTNFDFLPRKLLATSKIGFPEYYEQFYKNKSFLNLLKQKLRMKIFTIMSDKITLNGPFLIGSIDRYDQIIPYDCDITLMERILKKTEKRNKIIKIIHVPTKIDVKGTKYVKKAFHNLTKKYPAVEFQILFNLEHNKLIYELAQADIVIDQLLIGWYGTFGAEAMALGKVVMAFINPIYLQMVDYGKSLPVYNTNVSAFEKDLEFLINSPIEREKRGKEGQKFAARYHDARKTADLYLKVYEDCFK